MTRRLVFSPRSEADARWFRQYYAQIFPEGAKRASRQFLASRRTLLDNPEIGRKLNDAGVRELSIARTPFILIYRIMDAEIQVLRIWDARSDPDEKTLS